jgi:hypothetical protein
VPDAEVVEHWVYSYGLISPSKKIPKLFLSVASASAAPLPDGLATREFRRVDPNDLEAVLGFIRRWGALAPLGGHPYALLPPDYDSEEAARVTLWQTDQPLVDEIAPPIPVDLLMRHVRALRAVIDHWLAHQLGDGPGIAAAWTSNGFPEPAAEKDAWASFSSYMASALAPISPRIEVTGPGFTCGAQEPVTAYTAMMCQVRNDVASNTPWRVCENESCRRLFARQEGGAKAGQYRTTGVMYCTPQCARAQAQRRFRRKQAEAKKEKPKDG